MQNAVVELAEIAESAFSDYSNSSDFDLKSDGSRVTRLDRHIEQRWREHLGLHFPLHAIVGEEFGGRDPGGSFCWLLDPVDGTDDLTRGIPLSGFIAALTYCGLPLVAATGHPSLGIRSLAAYGRGTYVNHRRTEGMNGREVAEPAIAMPAAADFLRNGDDSELFRKLGKALPNHRIYRNLFAHTAVLIGALEAAVEFNVAEWDVVATRLLIEEAGGSYVTIDEWVDDAGVRRTKAAFGICSVVEQIVEVLSGRRRST